MKATIFFCLWVLIVPLTACSGNEAASLYETARLEEKQNSLDHARQLYEEILRKYPNAEVAADAKKRLDALGNTP